MYVHMFQHFSSCSVCLVNVCTVADELPHFPIILIEVLSVDSWHRFFHEGYTYIQIPAKPGGYTANEIPILSVLPGQVGTQQMRSQSCQSCQAR